MPETQAIVEAVAKAIRDELASLTVPEEEHREHHAFIRTYIEERRVQREEQMIKRERNEKIKAQVMGWGIVSVLGGIGTAFYQGLHYLREHLK